MKSEQREMMDVWDLITNKETRLTLKSDNHLLLQAIRQGILSFKQVAFNMYHSFYF